MKLLIEMHSRWLCINLD